MLFKTGYEFKHSHTVTIQATPQLLDMQGRQTSGPFGTVRDYRRVAQIVIWGIVNGRCLMMDRHRNTSGKC